ncbi:MAG: alpha-xylosidase, partial [Turicibacter sp.]
MGECIANHFKVGFKPFAAKEAIFQGNAYRIAFLTSRIVRLEYAIDGKFEDNPTQAFWYREQDVPKMTVKEDDQVLEVTTDHLRLKYFKEQPFSGDTLTIELKYSCKIWRFGLEEESNLGGTARTLDNVDGELKLEKGLMSRDGYVVIDDSKSLIFNEQSWLAPRQTHGIDTYF